MYCVILESLLFEIRIEYVSEHFYINVDSPMIMDNHEWILNNDEWEMLTSPVIGNGERLAFFEGD
jgi:hypothetical protein